MSKNREKARVEDYTSRTIVPSTKEKGDRVHATTDDLIRLGVDVSSFGQFDTHTPYDTLGKYDDGLVYGQDQNLFRATHQPWSHQAGNAVVGGVAGGILTAIEDAGYILDFENTIARARDIEEVETNWLSQIAKNAKENLTQEQFPIFRQGSDLIDWSDSGFYWESLRGLLDSAVGFGTVGLGVGSGIKAAFKYGGKALRAKRLSSYLSNIAPYLDDAAQKGQTFTSAYITNFGEGKMMALEMYDKTFEEIKKANPDMPDGQIRKLAGDRADQFMLRNKAFILTDAFALSGLSRGINSTRARARDLSWQSFRKSFGEGSTRNPLLQGLGESMEEIGQNVAQMEAGYQAKVDAGLTPEGVPTTLQERLVKFATSDQALLEGAMGFFGGPIQYGIIQGPQDFANRKDIRRRYNEQIKQVEDNQNFINERLASYIDSHNAVDIATLKGEQFAAEAIKEDLLADVALENFKRGTADQLERSLEDLRDNEELAKQNGLGDNYKEDVNKQIARLREMEAEYIRITHKYNNPVFQQFHGAIFKGQRQLRTIEDRLSGVTNKYNSMKQSIINDLNAQNAQVVNSAVVEIPLLKRERDQIANSLNTYKDIRESMITRNAIVDRNKRKGVNLIEKKTPTNKISKLINSVQSQLDELDGRISQNEEIVKNVPTAIPSAQLDKYVGNHELNKIQFEKNLLTTYSDQIKEELATITDPERAQEYLNNLSEDDKTNIEARAQEEKAKQDQSDRETKAQRSAEEKAVKQANSQPVATSESEQETRAKEESLNTPTTGNIVTDPLKPPKIIKAGTDQEAEKGSPVSPDVDQAIPAADVITTSTQRQSVEDFNDIMHRLIEEAENIVMQDTEVETRDADDIGKINMSNDALAYLSRDYIEVLTLKDGRLATRLKDANNNLSNDLRDPKLLSPKGFVEGTPLTLFLDKNYKVGDDTYESLLNKGRQAEAIRTIPSEDNIYNDRSYDYVPIGVKDNRGVIIGYLHDVAYPLNRVKEANIAEDINTIRAIRNALVKEHDGTFQSKVTEKRVGKLAVTADGRPITLSDAMSDPNLIVGIQTSKGLVTNKGQNLKVSNKKLRSGISYAFIVKDYEDGKPNYVGIPLLNKRLNTKHRLSLLSAVNLYLNQDTTSLISRDMFEAGYNLATPKDLKRYVESFMGLANLPPNTFLREYVLGDKSSNAYVDIRGDAVEASRGKGEGYITSFIDSGTGQRVYYAGLGRTNQVMLDQRLKEFAEENQREATPEEVEQITSEVNREFGEGGARKKIDLQDFLKRLDSILQKSYYHMNATRLQNDNMPLPIINPDNTITNESTSYTDFVKATHETNVVDFDLGDGEYTSFVQPIIRIAVPVLADVQTAGARGQVIVTREEKKRDIFTDNTTGLTVDFTDDLSFEATADFEKKLSKSLKAHRLEGLSAKEQDELISSFAYSIFNDLVAKGRGERLVLSDAFEKIRLSINVNLRGQLAKLDNDKRAKYNQRIDNLLTQWDKVKELTTRRVRKISAIRDFIKLEDEESVLGSTGNQLDSPIDLEGYNEKVDYDRSSLELDPKDTTSVRLKRFLSGIPDVNKKTGNNKLNSYIPFYKFIPYDQAFAELSGVLAGSPPNYKVMRARLEKYSGEKPYMNNVLQLLDNADDQVRNEFASEMAKHQVFMKTILMRYRTSKDDYDVHTIDTNRSSFAQTILGEWESNLSIDASNYHSGSPYFTQEQRTKLAQEFEDIKEQVDSRPANDTEESIDWLEDSVEMLDNWLSQMGIKMDNELLGDLIAERSRWEFHVKPDKGAFDIIAKNIKTRGNASIENNNLFDDSAVKRLAKLESHYRADIFTQSFRNGENKVIYNYSYNKLFTDRFMGLKNDPALLNRLLKNPFNKHSYWLQSLNDANSDFANVFNYFYFDSLKVGRRTGKTGDRLSDASMEVAELGLFTNNGISRQKGEKRVINLLHPTMGERRRVGVTVIGVNTELQPDGTKISDRTGDVLFREILLPEIERILYFQDKKKDGKEVDMEGFNAGASQFLLTPALNYDVAPDHLKGIWEKNGTKLKSIDELRELYFEPLRDFMISEVNRLVEEKLDSWVEYGIIDKKEKGTSLKYVDRKYIKNIAKEVLTDKDNWSVAKYTAYDFVVNTLVGNSNFYKTFIGDPAAFFKNDVIGTFNNVGKRLSMYTGPGRAIASDDVYTQGIMDDRIAGSLNESLRKIPQYDRIQTTDSQEYTTMDEHLFILEKTGRISKEQRKRYKMQADKGTLTPQELESLLFANINNPLLPTKPIYSNLIQDEEFLTERPVMIKSSSIPLIPQLTKGFEIDKLRVAMEKQGVSRLAFESAMKLGDRLRKENNQIFNADGTIIDKIVFDAKNTLRLPREGFRIQQDTVFDPNKSTVNDGSQQRKLTFTDLMHLPGMKERFERFNNAYGQIFNIKADRFIAKYTKEVDGNTIFDIDAVRSELRDEAITRGYSINDLDILSMSNEDFLKYIVFSESSTRIENLLNSLTDNQVRKNKMPGFSAALVSEEGWRFKTLIEAEQVEPPRGKGPTVEELAERTKLEKEQGELASKKRQLIENKEGDIKETQEREIFIAPTLPTIKSVKGKKVMMPVEIIETGEVVEEEVNALEARNDLDKRLKILEKLTDCIK